MNLDTKLKLIVPSLLACAVVAAGGCSNANKKGAKAQASSALPPLSQAALNVPVAPPPAPPAAPPADFTPAAPAQPVVYDPAAEQPVIDEPLADAADAAAPAAPVARARPRKAASGGTRYKVKKGESLWSIAQARYGNGNKWKQIAAANPKIDPNRVQAGQTITLP